MIPQVADKLLSIYGKEAKTLFDPYCGTGTSLVEGLLHGIDGIGTDLNPLARLIAEAKSNYSINISQVSEYIERFNQEAYNLDPDMPEIKNMDFWFNDGIAIKLGKIRAFINSIENSDVKLFFKIAFSETVRESSNTRKNEFKLFRYNQEKLKKWNPEPFMIMNEKLHRNLKGR